MLKYDRQLLIEFRGDGAGDGAAAGASADLLAKGEAKGLPSAFVRVPSRRSLADGPAGTGVWEDRPWHQTLKAELGKLTGSSRLYIAGEGDWRAQRVDDWGAADVADLLAEAGMPAVRIISIIADSAGRDRGSPAPDLLAEPADSFASQFHRRLKEKHGIEVEVYARAYPVAVLSEAHGEDRGRKETYPEDDDDQRIGGRERSKLKFGWSDGEQVRTWKDYGEQGNRPGKAKPEGRPPA